MELLEVIDKAIKEADIDFYPKQVSTGLWEVAPGLYCGEALMKQFEEQYKKTIKERYGDKDK